MKKLFLSVALTGIAACAFAQGFVALDNNANDPNASATATSGGLFFLKTGAAAAVPIGTDFNAAFYGGSDVASLTLISSFSGANAAGDNALGGGTFTDPTGNTYPVAGTSPGGSGLIKIEAWTGNFASYAAAQAGGAFVGTVTFTQLGLGGNTASGSIPAPDLTGMASLTMSAGAVPEPGTFALAGLGAAALLIFRRRK